MDCPRVSSFCACGSEFEFTTSSKSKEAVQISESCKQWLPPGFAACDLLRTKCKSHFTRWASQVSQHNPEPTPAETPKITKRRYGDPIDLHVDTTDRESPLEPDARMVLWVLLKRLEHNTEDYKGVAGVKIMEVSSSGGGQPFCMLHCPKRKGHSTRTQQRAAQIVMAAFHAQATDALTVSDMMVAVTKKRECKKNGLQIGMMTWKSSRPSAGCLTTLAEPSSVSASTTTGSSLVSPSPKCGPTERHGGMTLHTPKSMSNKLTERST